MEVPITQVDIGVLLTVYLFTETPGVERAREVALRHLVEFVIEEAGGQLFDDAVGEAARTTLGDGFDLTDEQIDVGTRVAINEGRVIAEDGKLRLADNRRHEIQAARHLYHQDEAHFADHLFRCIGDSLGHSVPDLAQPLIISAVQRVIINSARSLKNDLDVEMATGQVAGPAGNFDALASLRAELLTPADSFADGNVGALVEGVRSLFLEQDEPCHRHLNGLYSKVFYHQLLNFDPRVQEALLRALASTHWFLDTNVALDYVLESRPDERVTAQVVHLAKSLGVQLFISPGTRQEIAGQIAAAEWALQSTGDTRVERVLLASPGRVSPFFHAYVLARRRNANLTWANFIAPYRDIEQILLGKDALVAGEGFADASHHEHYARVWQCLRGIRSPHVSSNVIDHDAQNFIYIHEQRRQHQGNSLFGPSVWLITRDSSLRRLEQSMAGIFAIPHSKLVAQWASILFPLQHIGGFRLEDFVGHLVSTELGILPEDEGVDPEFLFSLRHPDFSIDTLLDLDPAHAAQVIVDLQHNAEARKLVAGLKNDDTEVQRQSGRQLTELALKTVVEGRTDAERKARESEDTLSAVRDELSETKERLTQTEARAAELELELLRKRRSLVGRLTSFFRGK